MAQQLPVGRRPSSLTPSLMAPPPPLSQSGGAGAAAAAAAAGSDGASVIQQSKSLNVLDKFGTAPSRPGPRKGPDTVSAGSLQLSSNGPLHRSAPPTPPFSSAHLSMVTIPSSYTPPPLLPLAPPPILPTPPPPPPSSEPDPPLSPTSSSSSSSSSSHHKDDTKLSRSISSSFKWVGSVRGSKKMSWDQYFERCGPMDFTRGTHTRELVRKYGIPAHYRGAFWRILSCSDELRDNDLSYHIIQSNYSQIDPETAEQIEKDLQRTFPDQQQFKGENAEGVLALRRILTAYSCFDSDLGYCQSMNFVVALLLLFMHEEDAFWTLVTIIQRLLPNDYYQSMFGVRVDIQTFCSLLALRLPKVWSHLDNLGIDRQIMQGLILPWFLCLYVNVLPLESTLRFFDSFFFEGDKVLFRVALAIFKLHEKQLLACETMGEVIQAIVGAPQNVEPHSLMDTAFDDGWLGRLKRGKIASLRAQHEREMAETCPFPRKQLQNASNGGSGGGSGGNNTATRSARPHGLRNAAPLRPEPQQPLSPKAKSPPPSHKSRAPSLSLPPGLSASASSPDLSLSLSPPVSPRGGQQPQPPSPIPFIQLPDTPPPAVPPKPSGATTTTTTAAAAATTTTTTTVAAVGLSSSASSPMLAMTSPPRALPVGTKPSSKMGPPPPIPPIDLLPSTTAFTSGEQEPPREGFVYRPGSTKRRPVVFASPSVYLPAPPPPTAPASAPAELEEEELDPRFAERYGRLSILVGRFSMMGPSLDD